MICYAAAVCPQTCAGQAGGRRGAAAGRCLLTSGQVLALQVGWHLGAHVPASGAHHHAGAAGWLQGREEGQGSRWGAPGAWTPPQGVHLPTSGCCSAPGGRWEPRSGPPHPHRHGGLDEAGGNAGLHLGAGGVSTTGWSGTKPARGGAPALPSHPSTNLSSSHLSTPPSCFSLCAPLCPHSTCPTRGVTHHNSTMQALSAKTAVAGTRVVSLPPSVAAGRPGAPDRHGMASIAHGASASPPAGPVQHLRGINPTRSLPCLACGEAARRGQGGNHLDGQPATLIAGGLALYFAARRWPRLPAPPAPRAPAWWCAPPPAPTGCPATTSQRTWRTAHCPAVSSRGLGLQRNLLIQAMRGPTTPGNAPPCLSLVPPC